MRFAQLAYDRNIHKTQKRRREVRQNNRASDLIERAKGGHQGAI